MNRRPVSLALALVVVAACARTPSGGQATFDPNPSAGGGARAGVVFVSGTYEQALGRARTENKLLMVDLYADWCGWCHKLDAEVFADARVAAALGGVIPIKLDADREGQAIAETYRVDGLPTILFLDGTGKLVKRLDGYLDADQMIAVAGALPKGSA